MVDCLREDGTPPPPNSANKQYDVKLFSCVTHELGIMLPSAIYKIHNLHPIDVINPPPPYIETHLVFFTTLYSSIHRGMEKKAPSIRSI